MYDTIIFNTGIPGVVLNQGNEFEIVFTRNPPNDISGTFWVVERTIYTHQKKFCTI